MMIRVVLLLMSILCSVMQLLYHNNEFGSLCYVYAMLLNGICLAHELQYNLLGIEAQQERYIFVYDL